MLDYKEFIEFISPIVSSLCCACETYIVLKLKNSSDAPINLVQGRELSETEELVEIALDVTLNVICEKFGNIRNQTRAKYFRIKS